VDLVRISLCQQWVAYFHDHEEKKHTVFTGVSSSLSVVLNKFYSHPNSNSDLCNFYIHSLILHIRQNLDKCLHDFA
jgi:hypothetical protein